MIAITSISPGHRNFDSQLKAIESWKKAGYEVVSLNSPEEIELLKDFDVKFIPTYRHNKSLFGKPYVTVSAIIDYLKEVKSKHSLIINSDIIIQDSQNITNELRNLSEDGIIIINRRDFDVDINQSTVYENGFDGFFINEKFLDTFPQTILCLGQCHWDYWLPYVSIENKVKVIRLKEPYLFHHAHPVQYSPQNWLKTGQIFAGEVGLTRFAKVNQMSNHAYRYIKLHAR